jgi:hypothetical protein
MSTPPLGDKKLSLYGKPIKMLPEVRLFAKKDKNTLRPGLKFWPDPEENTDDKLPESE